MPATSLLAERESLVTVRRNGGEDPIADPELRGAILRAFELKAKADEVERELSEKRALIAGRARRLQGGSGTVTFLARGLSLRVSRRFEASVPAEAVSALRRLLGGRFRDLVRVKTRHLATKALVEEAARREDLQGHITVRELSPRFTFTADPTYRP